MIQLELTGIRLDELWTAGKIYAKSSQTMSCCLPSVFDRQWESRRQSQETIVTETEQNIKRRTREYLGHDNGDRMHKTRRGNTISVRTPFSELASAENFRHCAEDTEQDAEAPPTAPHKILNPTGDSDRVAPP